MARLKLAFYGAIETMSCAPKPLSVGNYQGGPLLRDFITKVIIKRRSILSLRYYTTIITTFIILCNSTLCNIIT